ncbi:7TM diverse intracellular signaling domain-containing protein [Hydrogenophaga sp. 5NK40-0174]|uniref:sensor domain-containing diguanylate cyclase n=1 Tax=Hydrogenophaga sp. 5NK40-0174 TaxID=3127649 RepID=UPI00333ED4C7
MLSLIRPAIIRPAVLFLGLVLVLLPAIHAPARAGEAIAATSGNQPTLPFALNEDVPEIQLAGRSLYWVEAEGSRSVEQVEAEFSKLPFAVRPEGHRVKLSGNKALWIRFDVTEYTGQANWQIELNRAGTDEIALYWRNADGTWERAVAGDRYAVANWPSPDRFPVFDLPRYQDGQAQHYWVRIQHPLVPFSGTLILHNQNELRESRMAEQFILGGYFGTALLLIVVTLVNGWFYRDRSFTAFAFYATVLTLQVSASLGVGGLYLWPHAQFWNSQAEFILLPLLAAAGVYFARAVYMGKMSRWLDRLALLLGPGFLVIMLWHLTAMSTLSLQLLTLGGLLTLILTGRLIVLGWNQPEDWARLIATGMVPILVGGVMPVLRNWDILSNSFLVQYSMMIGAVIQGPILLYALVRKSAEQHEAQTRARALALNEPLTGLTNRHNFLVRLHDTLVRATRYRYRCALLLITLDNHDWFISQYGREVADRALVLTASLLRTQARDVDATARVDDATLAILMEGPVRPSQVVSTATSLVAHGLRPAPDLPSGTSLRLKIVMAMLPDQDPALELDPNLHLAWLQDALEDLKAEDKRAIAALNF